MKLLKTLLGFLFIGVAVATQKWLTSSDGRKYLVESEQKYNWFQALHYCTGLNLQLVEIYSEFKNGPFVEELKKEFGESHAIWLGATDHLSKEQELKRPFYWAATGNKMNFTYWHDGEPNNSGHKQNCVCTYKKSSDFKWDDDDCNVKHGVACEKHHLTPRLESIRNEKRTKVADILEPVLKDFDQVQQTQLELFQQLVKEGEKMETEIKPVLEGLRKTLNTGVENELAQHQKAMNAAVGKLVKLIIDDERNLEKTALEAHEKFVAGFRDIEKEIDDKITEDWEYQARSNVDDI